MEREMKDLRKWIMSAALLAGSAFAMATPASAGVGFSISIGVPGVGFDYNSGGYCDRWGCPDGFYNYPVWYGPVFVGGNWYQGPVYWRDWGGSRWYWVHGGWHRDEWRGPRPGWWSSSYHYGPALGFNYYHDHGFYIPQRHWDYWHGHGGYDWERSHNVDWRRDYDRHDDRGWGDRHDDRGWGDHHDNGNHWGDRHDDHADWGDHHDNGNHWGDRHDDHGDGDHHDNGNHYGDRHDDHHDHGDRHDDHHDDR